MPSRVWGVFFACLFFGKRQLTCTICVRYRMYRYRDNGNGMIIISMYPCYNAFQPVRGCMLRECVRYIREMCHLSALMDSVLEREEKKTPLLVDSLVSFFSCMDQATINGAVNDAKAFMRRKEIPEHDVNSLESTIESTNSQNQSQKSRDDDDDIYSDSQSQRNELEQQQMETCGEDYGMLMELNRFIKGDSVTPRIRLMRRFARLLFHDDIFEPPKGPRHASLVTGESRFTLALV